MRLLGYAAKSDSFNLIIVILQPKRIGREISGGVKELIERLVRYQ
tara:strand:- start:233 stop:367 length:135 start_codon:yes stop_codon:yes gene_type:complete